MANQQTRVLHMLVGLPRSGKSTKARALGFPIVEPDAIRKAYNCYPFNADLEPMIWATAHLMVHSLFNAGHNDVILDAVNHTRQRRNVWENKQYAIKYHLVDTCRDVCIARAIAGEQEYLVPIIERMASNFEWLNDEDC